MKKNLLIAIISVFTIGLVTFAGTYAYFVASSSATITGETENSVASTLSLTTTHVAEDLVPLSDNLIKNAVSKSSNKCIDKDGYEVCTLYQVTLSNKSASENLYGYIRTGTSTYTTDHLKFQVFDPSFTALTDVMTLSNVTDEIVYFEKGSDYYTTTSNGTVTYYLAIWLSDTGLPQPEDYSKTFDGFVGFESVSTAGNTAGRIEAEF